MSFNQAVEELTDLVENYLSKLPEEEQEARVAALARRDFSVARAANTKASKPARARGSRASSRGR
jgi:hypothetical protein